MKDGELTGCFLEAVAINYLAEVLQSFQANSYSTYLSYMSSSIVMALLQSRCCPDWRKLGRLDLSRALPKSCRKSDFTGGFLPCDANGNRAFN